MRRLTSEEFGYVGDLTLRVALDLEPVWSHETGSVTVRSCQNYIYDTESDDLESALEVPGLMTVEERETCQSLDNSMEQVMERMDDAHANCFMNGETALLQLMNSIVIKVAIFHVIATFKDELAVETSKAA